MNKYAVAYVLSSVPKNTERRVINGTIYLYSGEAIFAAIPQGHVFTPESHLALEIIEAESEKEAIETVKDTCPYWITQFNARKVE